MRRIYTVNEYGIVAKHDLGISTYVYSRDDGWWVTRLTGILNGDGSSNWDSCIYTRDAMDQDFEIALRLCEVFQP